MESTPETVSATGAEPMGNPFTAENSVVVNIRLDSRNQAALLQTVEAAMSTIIKQEQETSSCLHEQQMSSVGTGGAHSLMAIAEGAHIQALEVSDPQGQVLCIVKQEQDSDDDSQGLVPVMDLPVEAPESLKVGSSGDQDLMNVVIQTKEGESLNIQLPKKALHGTGLGGHCPVVEMNTGDATYQFECFLCGATFKKAAYLKTHMPVHTGERPFKCPECPSAFATQSQLTIHIRVHTGNTPFVSLAEFKAGKEHSQDGGNTTPPKKPFKCQECPASFKAPSHLERHVRHKHTEEKPYKCPHCTAVFQKPSELRRHLMRHTGETKHVCKECPAAFKTSSALKWHERAHCGEPKAHKCKECPAAFRTQHDLSTHVRIHTGEKPYKCSKCPGAFAQSSTLRKHMRIHNRNAPINTENELDPSLIPPFLIKRKRTGLGHGCQQCSARFVRPSDLVRHMRRHTGEKPFACTICKKAFSRQSDLNMHTKIHTGEKSFLCDVCKMAFRSRGDLNKHMRRHTGEKPYMCAQCGQMFRLLGNLKTHMKSHPEPEPLAIGEADDSNAQIFTVQIVDNQVPTDHSYMCPGAVFPATQHIIIQASEAAAAGYFRTPTTLASDYSQPKQVAEMGTQVADVGTQVTEITFEVDEPVQMEDKEVSTADAGFQYSPPPGADDDDGMEETGVAVGSQADASASTNAQIRMSIQGNTLGQPAYGMGMSDQPQSQSACVQPEYSMNVSFQPQDSMLQTHNSMGAVPQFDNTEYTSVLPDGSMNSSAQYQNSMDFSVQQDSSGNTFLPFRDIVNAQQTDNTVDTWPQSQSIVNTSGQLASSRIVPAQPGNTVGTPGQPVNPLPRPQNVINISISHDDKMNTLSQPHNIINISIGDDGTVNAVTQSPEILHTSAESQNVLNSVLRTLAASQHAENAKVELDISSGMHNYAQPQNAMRNVVQQGGSTVTPLQNPANTAVNLESSMHNYAMSYDAELKKEAAKDASAQPQYVSITVVKAGDTVDADQSQAADVLAELASCVGIVTPTPAQLESSVRMPGTSENDDASTSDAEIIYRYKCSVCKASFKREMHLNRHVLIHTGEKPYQCPLCDNAFFTKAQLTVHKRTHAGSDQPQGEEASPSADAPKTADASVGADAPESSVVPEGNGTVNVEELVKEALGKLGSEDVSGSRKTYKCWECDAEYANHTHLTRHAKNRHAVDKPYQCTRCPAAFKKPSELKRHIRSHTGQNPYVCPECPAAFTAMSSLKKHAKTAHKGEDKNFKCSSCSSTFSSQADLKTHLRIHTGEKPFKCSVCPAEFTQSANLNKHMVIHNRDAASRGSMAEDWDGPEDSRKLRMTPGAKPFSCSECAASFTRTSDLKIHFRKHTGERPYLCTECPSTFARLTDLKMHLKIHTGERGFQCKECPAAFRSKGDLNKHVRVHTGEKPYMCAECGSTFRQSGSLKAHLKSHVGLEHKFKGGTAKQDLQPMTAS